MGWTSWAKIESAEVPNPNAHYYEAAAAGKYIATRLLTHGGTTIVFALGKTKDESSLFFDYSVLNANDQNPTSSAAQPQATEAIEKLDSDSWFENVKRLPFPTEIRVVGREAVPCFQIPAVDSSKRSVDRAAKEQQDPWNSTTLCLTDPKATNFQVLSDGKHIFLFRQSVANSVTYSNPFMTASTDKDPFLNGFGIKSPPVDGNLLCDRFSLVDADLKPALEVRYKRSGQKRLPLNELDTLATKSIDNVPFYEPTFSLPFLTHMVDGRFTVLRAPTMVNDMYRWMFFVYSGRTQQLENYTLDVAADGLFDVLGQTYYTCDNPGHSDLQVFSTAPGACTAYDTDKNDACGWPRTAMIPKAVLSERAVNLDGKATGAMLVLTNPLDLTQSQFSQGFTIEAWVCPEDFWTKRPDEGSNDGAGSATAAEKNQEPSLPPANSSFCLFSLAQSNQARGNWPSVFMDDRLRLVLRSSGDSDILMSSEQSLKADFWNHVAVTFTGGGAGEFRLVVNGHASLSAKRYKLPEGTTGGVLKGFLAQEVGNDTSRFQGLIDEARVWSYPHHPDTIADRKSKRVTGMEPNLRACWHFDEGGLSKAYDATGNGNDIDLKDANKPLTALWEASSAPILGGAGLTRRVVRLPDTITLRGGFGASVYYDQVSISRDGEEKESASKPLKRSARVLFCFVASLSSFPTTWSPYLAVLDVGLLSDGTLSDWPATISLPQIALSDGSGQTGKQAKTSLLFVDAQGMEIFGGLLNFDAAQCTPDAPVVWDSATGKISIYFRGGSGVFSVLAYDTTRTIDVSNLRTLAGHEGLVAAGKLRQAQSIAVETYLCSWAAADVAVDLVLAATMPDGSKIWERWKGIPSNLERACNLLSGARPVHTAKIGVFQSFERMPDLAKDGAYAHVSALQKPRRLVLESKITGPVPLAMCLEVDGCYYQILAAAKVGDPSLVVAPYFRPMTKDGKSLATPRQGSLVRFLGYDHRHLVVCDGKAAGDFSRGSSIASFALIQSDPSVELSGKEVLPPNKRSFISGRGESPCISSHIHSTTFRTDRDGSSGVYSMLEDIPTTGATAGIAFESWIRVHETSARVIVAYQAEQLPRNEGTDPESQTFVLASGPYPEDRILNEDTDTTLYELKGNANGTLFKLVPPSTLTSGSWMHFALSMHNTMALRFSGANYVDLGTAAEWNVSDFTLVFTVQLEDVGREQIILTKASSFGSPTPILVKVLPKGNLCLSYHAGDETGANVRERRMISSEATPLIKGQGYKVFISRNLVRVERSNKGPRSVQRLAMRVWRTDDSILIDKQPPTVDKLKQAEIPSSDTNSLLVGTDVVEECGSASTSDSPLTLGSAPWAPDQGLVGIIGPIRFFSTALTVPASSAVFCTHNASDKSLIGSWSFKGNGTQALIDDGGRNNGTLKKNPRWVISPYKPDQQLSVYINGVRVPTTTTAMTVALRAPAGPHSLTIGNSLQREGPTRYLGMARNFDGELDEMRIWNVPRTRENFCSTMFSRLSESHADLAVYFPFDPPPAPADPPAGTATATDYGILTDASGNGWHLTPLLGNKIFLGYSDVPVGYDGRCVFDELSSIREGRDSGAETSCYPSVTEYSDLQISAMGTMEGSYKRAYAYIDLKGRLCLETGFRIGSLTAEWVSQVQTAPTLIGYIEGAPPVPSENYMSSGERPITSIRFSNASRCTYSYGLRSETGQEFDLSASVGLGVRWETSAGFGVYNSMTKGEIKAGVKAVIDTNSASVTNNVSTSTTNTNMEMKAELSSRWIDGEGYNFANVGMALVESEAADVFALRLKTRGPMSPLVAYQMRPNPDIPKDQNLVSFEINKSYTKQGTLDGRSGLHNDKDYPAMSEAPKDASYFKPAEAYALKERIRRAEQERACEFERYQIEGQKAPKRELPSRTKRNICNTYVWTADGGTLEAETSLMDFVQSEVTFNSHFRSGVGGSFGMEASLGMVLAVGSVDALWSSHTSVMQQKEKQSETQFSLVAQLPQHVDLRRQDPNRPNKALSKVPGSVDAYRWMSFWLEPSTENTDTFFSQVVDPEWLESDDSNARVLRELRRSLEHETGNARTKAWRVLHRCTFVSRVPEPISSNLPGTIARAETQNQQKAKGMILADVSCNWDMLLQLEPLARGSKSQAEIARSCEKKIRELYPSLRASQDMYIKLLELLEAYLGIEPPLLSQD